jgi:hypothetical protein
MRVDVNLATRPFQNRTPHFLLLGTLAVLAGGLTAWNVGLFLRSHAAQVAVETQRGELEADEHALEVRRVAAASRLARADLKPLALRAQAANEVLAQKALSWTLLLQRLEQQLPWQAALRSIHAGVTPESVTLDLDVRAKTYDDALLLIDSLEKSPCFSDVYPRQDKDPSTGQSEYAMTLSATYDPFCGDAPASVTQRKGRASITRRPRG